MLRSLLAVVSCAVACATGVGAQDAQDLTARIPFRAPVISLPLTADSLQNGLADLAGVVGVPIGYEALPEPSQQPAPPDGILEAEGRTVEEVLDAIVAGQPLYQWTVENRVVHLRPQAAVTNPDDILNRRIDAFVLQDVTLDWALREVRFALRPELRHGGIVGSGLSPSALGLRRFSVSVRRTTVLGALDAIVKAHGASSWSVTYPVDTGDAWPYRISFQTFDGWSTTW